MQPDCVQFVGCYNAVTIAVILRRLTLSVDSPAVIVNYGYQQTEVKIIYIAKQTRETLRIKC